MGNFFTSSQNEHPLEPLTSSQVTVPYWEILWKVEGAYRTRDLVQREQRLQHLRDRYGNDLVTQALQDRYYAWSDVIVDGVVVEPHPDWNPPISLGKVIPSEWSNVIANAPYLGDFKQMNDIQTEHKGLVVYSLNYVPPPQQRPENSGGKARKFEYIPPKGMRVSRQNHFILGFEATGKENVNIICGGQIIETIEAFDIRKEAPTESGFYVAFRVPFNYMSITFHEFEITTVVKLRCARFMDSSSCNPYVWHDLMDLPLYKSKYRIIQGLCGKGHLS